MRIISIANQKGGCGKTTTAINLSAALSVNNRRVLLIDLDPQAHASLGLNLENQDSIYNVISRLTPRKLRIENIIQKVHDGFDIVPSNVLVGTLEQELADEIGREQKLTEIIRGVRNDYDYILIDCPPSLGFLTVNALRASDEVVIPVETSRFSMQGVDHLLDIIHLIRDRLNHQVDYRILITMFDSRLRHSFSMLSKIRERFSDVLYDTMIHINVKLKESAVMGETVVTFDKYCRGSKDYFSLAKEMISRESAGAEVAQAAEAVAAGAKAGTREAVETAADAGFQPLSGRMQSLVKEQSPQLFSTTFTLEAAEAQSVYVTGSFNDWSLDETCRMKYENGRWTARIPLQPGTHKYQFIIDGRWREDPTNPSQERNSFGDINSLIEVVPHVKA
ncbi:MAG: AAA family ATPase [Candidatus Omnitrophota bacterium]|nr:AAA family ATPase [Candidatus Omnitrophota bacterium]MDZ4243105.1 AAA family ATPase [Candidatus Omnitrophota bacterium]